MLCLRDPLRLIASFNRPNIAYSVRYQLAGSRPVVDQIAQLIGVRNNPAVLGQVGQAFGRAASTSASHETVSCRHSSSWYSRYCRCPSM